MMRLAEEPKELSRADMTRPMDRQDLHIRLPPTSTGKETTGPGDPDTVAGRVLGARDTRSGTSQRGFGSEPIQGWSERWNRSTRESGHRFGGSPFDSLRRIRARPTWAGSP